jgi:ABC-type multidrug transport system permease subunit
LPIARWSPLAGRIVADVIKQAWAIALLIGVGMILGFRVGTGPLGVVAAFGLLLTFALAATWMSVLVGMVVSAPEKVQIFGFVLIFPITFASNAFAPTGTMPGWLQAWVKVNPVTVLADAVRGLLSGGPVAGPAAQSLLWAAILLVVFAPLSVWAFKRRV